MVIVPTLQQVRTSLVSVERPLQSGADVGNNVIIPRAFLDKLLATGNACKVCGEPVTLVSPDISLADISFTVECRSCSAAHLSFAIPCVRGINGQLSNFTASDLAIVYETLLSGAGFPGCARIYSSLNLPTMHSGKFYRHARFLYTNMELLLANSNERLLESLKVSHATLFGAASAAGPFLDIDVSFDGTLMTRGYRSHVGVGFVIHCDTGFVIDFEVLSNFCEICHKQKKIVSEENFLVWK